MQDAAPAMNSALPTFSTSTHAASSVPVWHVRLLGAFQLVDGSHTPHRLRSRAAKLLLARVAMAPEREHAREELATLLWPEADGDAARNRLRQTLSELKAVLEPPGAPTVLLADRRALRAVPGTLWCVCSADRRSPLSVLPPTPRTIF